MEDDILDRAFKSGEQLELFPRPLAADRGTSTPLSRQ
jgi:hypothetical protein